MEWLLNKLMRSISGIKKKGQVYMEKLQNKKWCNDWNRKRD